MVMRYIARRLILLLPVVFGISLLVFMVVHLAPGDPIKLKLGSNYEAEVADAYREKYGLDKPVPVQYVMWLGRVIRGDFGVSFFTNEPVLKMIADRAPITILLAVGTMIVALTIAIPLGILAAVHRNSWFDNVSRVLSMLGVSLPVFWLGLILIIIFALWIPIFPPGGTVDEYGLKAIVLPSVTLGVAFAALITRMMRSTMIDVLGEDYVRTARAKGLTERMVQYRHAFKNAFIPVLTVVGLQFGTILGGAVLTETIFNLPGLGRLLVDSVTRRDFPVIQGGVLFISLVFVIANLLVDVLYGVLDPRITYK
jgi:peptide/nickel transport system permease protein